MIQVLMFCEGVTDFEPICVLIKKVVCCPEIVVIRKTRKELRQETFVLSGRRGIHKHVTDIDRLAMTAKKAKCKYVAYHQDADGDDAVVYKSIAERFSEHAGALSCLTIVPKEMIESWLLADEQAYVTVFGSVPEHPALPNKPEKMWGEKDNPVSNYPKHVMSRVLGQYNKTPNREIYTKIAESCNIDALKTRCPVSFARFCDDLAGIKLRMSTITKVMF